MPVIDCTTGKVREHTVKELAAIEADRARAAAPEVDDKAKLLAAMQAEGLITQAKADAVLARLKSDA